MVSKMKKGASKKTDRNRSKKTHLIAMSDLAIKAVFFTSLTGSAVFYLPKFFFDGFEDPKHFIIQCGAAVILSLLLFRSVLKGSLKVTIPQCLLPLVFLFLISAASVGWGLNPWLGIEELYRISALAGYCFFAFYLSRKQKITTPFYFIVFSSLALSIWALFLEYEPLRKSVYPYIINNYNMPGYTATFYRSMMGTQGNPNFMMHILTLSVPLALGGFIQEARSYRFSSRRRIIIILLAMAVLLPSFCILSSENRSALLALIAGLGFFAVFSLLKEGRSIVRATKQVVKKRAGRVVLIIVMLIVLGTALLMTSTTRGRTLGAIISQSTSERLKNWSERFGQLKDLDNIAVYSRVVFLETGARMFIENPIFGQGIGQFVLNLPKYKSEKNWSYFFMMHSPILRWVDMPRQSHNEFLQVALATGAIGLIAFLAFWIGFFYLVYRYYMASDSDKLPHLILGIGAGVFATLVNALFTFPLQTATSATFFWVVAGLLVAECTASMTKPGWLVRERTLLKVSLDSKLANRLLSLVTSVILLLCLSASVSQIRAGYLLTDALKSSSKDLDYSIRRCEASIRWAPYRYENHHVLAFLHMYANNTKEAIQHFERTIKLAPYFPEPYQNLPGFHLVNGDSARAETLIRKFYDFHPRNITNINYSDLDCILGLSILRDTSASRFEEAEKWLKLSHATEARMSLGAGYYDQGRYDEAKEIFEQLSKSLIGAKDKRNIIIRLNALNYLGLILINEEELDKARATFREIITIANKNGPEFNNYKNQSGKYIEYIEHKLANRN
jgi:O-antigen ligase/tetratricopeptide (TPR) repeat protein